MSNEHALGSGRAGQGNDPGLLVPGQLGRCRSLTCRPSRGLVGQKKDLGTGTAVWLNVSLLTKMLKAFVFFRRQLDYVFFAGIVYLLTAIMKNIP